MKLAAKRAEALAQADAAHEPEAAETSANTSVKKEKKHVERYSKPVEGADEEDEDEVDGEHQRAQKQLKGKAGKVRSSSVAVTSSVVLADGEKGRRDSVGTHIQNTHQTMEIAPEIIYTRNLTR
jgi:hypothetical protein